MVETKFIVAWKQQSQSSNFRITKLLIYDFISLYLNLNRKQQVRGQTNVALQIFEISTVA